MIGFTKRNNKKIFSNITRVFGCFLLFLAIRGLIITIMTYNSNGQFFDDMFFCFFIILVSLFFLTQYYTFDENNLTLHIYCLKKNTAITSIVEIRYFIFGIVLLTVYREMLNERYTVPITLFCTRKQSIKKLAGFFDVLSRKNISCVINI